jgi:nicotinamidase-related amidase
LGAAPVLEKTVFSACGAPRIQEYLHSDHPYSVLICGIETHVCVNQTVHDLLEDGHRVQLAVDAIGSRKDQDREISLRKMERSGAVLTTSEAATFEILRDARHPKFKEVQALYK